MKTELTQFPPYKQQSFGGSERSARNVHCAMPNDLSSEIWGDFSEIIVLCTVLYCTVVCTQCTTQYMYYCTVQRSAAEERMSKRRGEFDVQDSDSDSESTEREPLVFSCRMDSAKEVMIPRKQKLCSVVVVQHTWHSVARVLTWHSPFPLARQLHSLLACLASFKGSRKDEIAHVEFSPNELVFMVKARSKHTQVCFFV